MNVLEAVAAAREGKIVKWGEENPIYGYQVTYLPFGAKKLFISAQSRIARRDECPEVQEDLLDDSYEEGFSVCSDALESNDFEVISLEQMLAECIEEWKRVNE